MGSPLGVSPGEAGDSLATFHVIEIYSYMEFSRDRTRLADRAWNWPVYHPVRDILGNTSLRTLRQISPRQCIYVLHIDLAW
jgi:hypothetical protein